VILTRVSAFTQSYSSASPSETSKAKRKQDSSDADAIKAALAQIQWQDTQIAAYQSNQSAEDAEIQRKLAKYTWWLVIVGAVQFAALIAQAIVFWFTLRQMRDTSRRQLRAYLGISESAVKLEPENIPEGQIHIKNFGQTPAYKVRHWTGVAIFPHPLNLQLPEPPQELRISLAIIGAGAHHINVVPVKQPIPAQWVQLLGTPQYTVYVYGCVTYEDIFGREWRTQYRLFYGGPNGARKKRDKNGVLLGFMSSDSQGNEAT
jgi:hypothetical protein